MVKTFARVSGICGRRIPRVFLAVLRRMQSRRLKMSWRRSKIEMMRAQRETAT
jgi:hypothetical protein